MRPGVAADGRFWRTGLRVANPMTRQAAHGTTCCNGCDENQFVQAGLLPAPAHCLAGRQVQAQGQAPWPGRPPLTPAQSAAKNRIPGSMRTRRRNAKPSQWNPNAREVALACDKRGLSPQRTVSQAIGSASEARPSGVASLLTLRPPGNSLFTGRSGGFRHERPFPHRKGLEATCEPELCGIWLSSAVC